MAKDFETLIEPEEIKKARKELKKDYKQLKKELKQIEKTSGLLGEVLTRGFLTVYILYLLDKNPLCGNEIVTEIAERTGGRWQPSPGGVYPLLRKMEKSGFASGEWEDSDKRTRRNYTITPEGRKELKRLQEALRPKAENTLEVFRIVSGDLFGKGK